jgi:Ni,Fe-hydrogenase III large subunit
MTQLFSFKTVEEAEAKLDSLGGYKDPAEVVPLKGASAHEVAVGPVHAGVIEPGHFRFQCMGEDVYNLQIFLGYQHRGVEEAIVNADGNIARQIALAETCAGDTSAAAAIAFAELMECAFPARYSAPDAEAVRLRNILLELERIANHTGDLGALAGDVAFLQTASFCGRIRRE